MNSFETCPQVTLQAFLFFGLIEGLYLTNITHSDLALSIGSATFNSIIQVYRLKKESEAAQETFVQYALNCITARFGWVPFDHKLQQFAKAKDVKNLEVCKRKLIFGQKLLLI